MTPVDDVPHWLQPLAESLGMPIVRSYGSRYADISFNRHLVWMCRSCGTRVNDRYQHELEHRKESWVSHVDRLYEICKELFG